MITPFDTNSSIRFIVYFLYLLADFIDYLYLLLKIYRVLCFTKIVLDNFPLANPYRGIFSVIRVITAPYFKFWDKVFKLGTGSFDASGIIGFQALSMLIDILLHCKEYCKIEAEYLFNTLP